MSVNFALNSALDVSALAGTFRANGHVSIADFLIEECAQQLRAALCSRQDWNWAINAGSQVYDIAPDTRANMSVEQLAELDRRIEREAQNGFQFRFSSVRVPDAIAERRPQTDIVHDFAEFMRSDPVLELMKAISGKMDIIFADAQGTAYHRGDFLTGHDDDIEGKNRRLAYVMGLTPEWRVEWGGLLLFHGADGSIQGLMPRFNCLNIFALPIMHSVSQVTAFAGAVRYGVTGWLRSEMPD